MNTEEYRQLLNKLEAIDRPSLEQSVNEALPLAALALGRAAMPALTKVGQLGKAAWQGAKFGAKNPVAAKSLGWKSGLSNITGTAAAKTAGTIARNPGKSLLALGVSTVALNNASDYLEKISSGEIDIEDLDPETQETLADFVKRLEEISKKKSKSI